MIRFENVGLRYDMGPEVLRDLSFRIDPQSFQFLCGPSGAGKTSLMRMLFLALRPTRGMVTVMGRDAATMRRDELPELRRRIGIVFQDFRLLPNKTVEQNVAFALQVIGRSRRSIQALVPETLELVGPDRNQFVAVAVHFASEPIASGRG